MKRVGLPKYVYKIHKNKLIYLGLLIVISILSLTTVLTFKLYLRKIYTKEYNKKNTANVVLILSKDKYKENIDEIKQLVNYKEIKKEKSVIALTKINNNYEQLILLPSNKESIYINSTIKSKKNIEIITNSKIYKYKVKGKINDLLFTNKIKSVYIKKSSLEKIIKENQNNEVYVITLKVLDSQSSYKNILKYLEVNNMTPLYIDYDKNIISERIEVHNYIFKILLFPTILLCVITSIIYVYITIKIKLDEKKNINNLIKIGYSKEIINKCIYNETYKIGIISTIIGIILSILLCTLISNRLGISSVLNYKYLLIIPLITILLMVILSLLSNIKYSKKILIVLLEVLTIINIIYPIIVIKNNKLEIKRLMDEDSSIIIKSSSEINIKENKNISNIIKLTEKII